MIGSWVSSATPATPFAQLLDVLPPLLDEGLPALAGQTADAARPVPVELVAHVLAEEVRAAHAGALGHAQELSLEADHPAAQAVEVVDHLLDTRRAQPDAGDELQELDLELAVNACPGTERARPRRGPRRGEASAVARTSCSGPRFGRGFRGPSARGSPPSPPGTCWCPRRRLSSSSGFSSAPSRLSSASSFLFSSLFSSLSSSLTSPAAPSRVCVPAPSGVCAPSPGRGGNVHVPPRPTTHRGVEVDDVAQEGGCRP